MNHIDLRNLSIQHAYHLLKPLLETIANAKRILILVGPDILPEIKDVNPTVFHYFITTIAQQGRLLGCSTKDTKSFGPVLDELLEGCNLKDKSPSFDHNNGCVWGPFLENSEEEGPTVVILAGLRQPSELYSEGQRYCNQMKDSIPVWISPEPGEIFGLRQSNVLGTCDQVATHMMTWRLERMPNALHDTEVARLRVKWNLYIARSEPAAFLDLCNSIDEESLMHLMQRNEVLASRLATVVKRYHDCIADDGDVVMTSDSTGYDESVDYGKLMEDESLDTLDQIIFKDSFLRSSTDVQPEPKTNGPIEETSLPISL
ncbi:hypothetical protein NHQ30_011301 [Ciborinia camelliae]|nr:hypothetical protein NHQ30_011301 [Ciborinia camelliae]